VVNVTPDSFSDGGAHSAPKAAIAHGRRLVDEGADILEIGGESTRPGAVAIAPDEEWARIAPVLEGLRGLGAPISVDTRNAAVMRRAIVAGAAVVNDISALTHDPDALATVAGSGAAVVLMHMKGTPETMRATPHYEDVAREVRDYLEARIRACEAAGIERARIGIDPGLGFAKNAAHNRDMLAGLALLTDLGCPVMVGASRKGLLREVRHRAAPSNRLGASIAAALAALDRGARLLRVHDVAQTAQAVAVWRALRDG
jgi:dihydropteroate synthase